MGIAVENMFGILSENATQTFQMLFPTDFAAADKILAATAKKRGSSDYSYVSQMGRD